MKSAVFSLSALVAAVSAQSIGDLPSCGRICANNMLSEDIAESLGCEPGNIQCLCLNVDFTYGFRDCSLAVCSPDEAMRIMDYGRNICSNVGVQISTTEGQPIATRTGSAESDDASINYSTVFGTVTSDGETVTAPIATTIVGVGAGAGDAASSAAGVVTTLTQDGSAVVSTITSEAGDAASSVSSNVGSAIDSVTSEAASITSSLASEASSAASEAGSSLSSVASDLSSDIAGASSTLSSVLSEITNIDSTSTGNEGEVITTTDADGNTFTTSESDGAAMPQKTAAPLGMIAAAGLAALLI